MLFFSLPMNVELERDHSVNGEYAVRVTHLRNQEQIWLQFLNAKHSIEAKIEVSRMKMCQFRFDRKKLRQLTGVNRFGICLSYTI